MTARPTIGPSRADNDIVTNLDWNNDVVAHANWAQEVMQGLNTDKIPLSAISGTVGYWPNAAINGGFEIWQRGTGPFSTNNAYCADRWKIIISGGSSFSVTRNNTVDTGSQYCAGYSYIHAIGGAAALTQNIENFAEYRGRTMVMKVRVTANSTGMYASVADGTQTVISSGPTRTSNVGGVQTLVVTINVSPSATFLTFGVNIDSVNTTGTIDNLMFCVSATPQDYVPRQPAEELMLCQRHYQVVRVSQRWRTQAAAGEAHDMPVIYPVRMYTTPTVVLTAGTRNNIASANFFDVASDGGRYENTGTAAAATDTYALVESLALSADV